MRRSKIFFVGILAAIMISVNISAAEPTEIDDAVSRYRRRRLCHT